MSVLLVIACSGFGRRGSDPLYEADPALYLKQQHRSLSSLQYSCDVVIVNNGGTQPYLDYLDTLRGTYPVIDRENKGMSLGALSCAHQTYPGYDYYILTEDDYIFVLDHFDEEMVELIKSVDDCGYMCQIVATDASCPVPFPSALAGIASVKLLERLGGIRGEDEPSNHAMGDQMQKALGMQISETRQFIVADMGSRFKAPFRDAHEIKMYYPEAPYTLMVPSQMYTREFS